MDELNRIIKPLRGWGSGQEPPFDFYGLCMNLRTLWNLSDAQSDDLLQEAFRSWSHYSGNWEYPVPDPEAPFDEVAAHKIYSDRSDRHDLWDDSPYGNLRRELCLHTADWLEANKSKVLLLFEEKFHD